MKTGYYAKQKAYSKEVVSISGDCGKIADFNGKTCKELAPKYGFWKKWHDQIGVLSEDENMAFYIHHYYGEVLKKLDANEVYENLQDAVLLCYEKPPQFCHRHIVSVWIEEMTGHKVDEIGYENNFLLLAEKEKIKAILDKEIARNSLTLTSK